VSIKKILPISFFILIWIIPPSWAKASAACTADVDHHSVTTYSQTSFTFSVTNTGSDPIVWLKLTRPSSNFTSDIEFESSQVEIALGETYTFSGDAITSGSEAASANWTIMTSSDPGGAGAVSCGGNLGTEISGIGTDTFAPRLSTITISDVSDTSATLTWTTDENASTVVYYGPGADPNYALTSIDNTLIATHIIVLTNLLPNNAYHFYIANTDSLGNPNETGDFSFVTAKEGTVITNTTTTEIKTLITAAPTPTPIPDKKPPEITLKTDFSKVYEKAPQIEGIVSDDTGLSQIEYSIDDGRNWLLIDQNLDSRKSASFSFTPAIKDDGDYAIKIRATDTHENAIVTKSHKLIIDRLPPLVGGVLFSIGAQILEPDSDGNLSLLSGMNTKVTVSAVGGPNEVILSAGTMDIPLSKNQETGLWSATMQFTNEGNYILLAKASDGAGNKTERPLFTIHILKNGRVLSNYDTSIDAHVKVYSLDEKLLTFSLWNGSVYNQENPQSTNIDGSYSFILPPGTYYIEVMAPGMQTQKSQIFTLAHVTPIQSDFLLSSKRALHIGPFIIPFFDFRQSTTTIDLNVVPDSTEQIDERIHMEFPFFDFGTIDSNDLKGKPSLVTVLSTWFPQSTDQLAILEKLQNNQSFHTLVIMTEDPSSRTSIFAKRGNYAVPIIADPDGEIIDPLHISSLPTHFFINRKGVITKVKVGILDAEDILENMIQ
jgi:hypothetical protein